MHFQRLLILPVSYKWYLHCCCFLKTNKIMVDGQKAKSRQAFLCTCCLMPTECIRGCGQRPFTHGDGRQSWLQSPNNLLRQIQLTRLKSHPQAISQRGFSCCTSGTCIRLSGHMQKLDWTWPEMLLELSTIYISSSVYSTTSDQCQRCTRC